MEVELQIYLIEPITFMHPKYQGIWTQSAIYGNFAHYPAFPISALSPLKIRVQNYFLYCQEEDVRV